MTGLNVSGPSRLSSLAEHLRCHGPDIFDWPYVKDLKDWTSENDSKVVLWINETTRTGDRSDKRTAFDFVFKKGDLRHPLTFLDTSKGLLSFRLRVACLQSFNSMVYKSVPLVDVTSTERQSLGFRLRHSTDVVFEDQKKRSLKAALEVRSVEAPRGFAPRAKCLAANPSPSLMSRTSPPLRLSSLVAGHSGVGRQLDHGHPRQLPRVQVPREGAHDHR